MDYKALLKKYWQGETTVEEEKMLKKYFQGETIDQELLPYQPMFTYLTKEKENSLPRSVEGLLQLDKPSKLQVRTKKWTNYKWIGIAATILLLLVAGAGNFQMNQPTKEERLAEFWKSQEIKDPQIALQKTRAALLLVSQKLNNGRDAALKQVVKVQEVGQFIKVNR